MSNLPLGSTSRGINLKISSRLSPWTWSYKELLIISHCYVILMIFTLDLFFSLRNILKRLSIDTMIDGMLKMCIPFCLTGYASCWINAFFFITTGLLNTMRCLRVVFEASPIMVIPEMMKSSSNIKVSKNIVMLLRRSSDLNSSGLKAPGLPIK